MNGEIMNKQKFIDLVYEESGVRKADVVDVVNSVFKCIVDVTCDNREPVALTGFGTFEPYKREARVAMNPNTHEKHIVDAKYCVKFRPSRKYKERLASK